MEKNSIYEIILRIQNNLKSFNEINEIKDNPGIYGIALDSSNFPFFNDSSIVKGTILYIGKSDSSIKKRTINTHFANQKTGSSTLRRSLGAIMKDELYLNPIPRSTEEKRCRDFTFINESEKKLTNWMIENLSIGFYNYAEGKKKLKALEVELIRKLVPILNLKSNVSLNPHLSELMELRARCKDIARIKFENNN